MGLSAALAGRVPVPFIFQEQCGRDWSFKSTFHERTGLRVAGLCTCALKMAPGIQAAQPLAARVPVCQNARAEIPDSEPAPVGPGGRLT
jgi:hypothetical protein